jgi:hypothetical protein
MQHGTTAPLEGHDYNTGAHCTVAGCLGPKGLIPRHYKCAECGCDCTAGAPGGPATQDTRGVIRCYLCQAEWERERAALSAWTHAELNTLIVALSQIAEGDPLAVTDEHRRIATEILARHEAP